MVEVLYNALGLGTTDRNTKSNINDKLITLNLWPYPKKGCVCFTFDCEGTYGGGSSEIGETEVVPHLSDLLKNNGIRGTFNFVGKIAQDFPDIVSSLNNNNHDVAGHGYAHEFMHKMTYKEQKTDIMKTSDSIYEASGLRIQGWRSPFCIFTQDTYDILESLNFKWTSNWGRSMWGNLPFTPIINDKVYKLVEIPFDDVHFDAVVYRKNNLTPGQSLDLWSNYLTNISNQGGMFTFLFHPVNLAEDDERVNSIDNLIQKTAALNNMWTPTFSEIVDRYSVINNIKLHYEAINSVDNNIKMKISLINYNEKDVTNLSIRFFTEFKLKDDLDTPNIEMERSINGTIVWINIPLLKPDDSIEIQYEFGILHEGG